MFARYTLFELKRQCTSTKTIVTTFVFFLGLVIFLSYNAFMHRDARERHIYNLHAEESSLVELTAMIRALREFQRSDDTSDIHMPRTDAENAAILTMMNNEIRFISAQRIHIGLDRPELPPIWERQLDALVSQHERLLRDFYAWRRVRAEYLGVDVTEIGFNDPTMEHRYSTRFTEASLMNTIQFYRYLQNTGVPPMYSPYDPSAFHFTHRILVTLGAFILPILAILLSADVFSKEADTGGYKTLLLQPLSRTKVYLAKLVSSYIVCLAAFVLPLILIFIIAGLFFGVGTGGYPVPFTPAGIQLATAYETSEAVLARLEPYTTMPGGFISTVAYIARVFPFIALYVLFVVSLTVFVSMPAKDSVFALSASSGVVLTSFVLTEFGFGRILWNPIAYADINLIITSGYTGFFWYPALCAVLLAMAGIWWFNKKDIIC